MEKEKEERREENEKLGKSLHEMVCMDVRMEVWEKVKGRKRKGREGKRKG